MLKSFYINKIKNDVHPTMVTTFMTTNVGFSKSNINIKKWSTRVFVICKINSTQIFPRFYFVFTKKKIKILLYRMENNVILYIRYYIYNVINSMYELDSNLNKCNLRAMKLKNIYLYCFFFNLKNRSKYVKSVRCNY